MRFLLQPYALIVVLLASGSHRIVPAADEPRFTLWQPVALPPSPWPGVGQIAIERGGVLWALANNEVYVLGRREAPPANGREMRSENI